MDHYLLKSFIAIIFQYLQNVSGLILSLFAPAGHFSCSIADGKYVIRRDDRLIFAGVFRWHGRFVKGACRLKLRSHPPRFRDINKPDSFPESGIFGLTSAARFALTVLIGDIFLTTGLQNSPFGEAGSRRSGAAGTNPGNGHPPAKP